MRMCRNPHVSGRAAAVMRQPGWQALTPFQRRVYGALLRVPSGRVTTYAALARAIDCVSARAIGQALRRNSLAPAVPCHRVIASDLTLGGFRGRREGPDVDHKLECLRREGVRFADGRLVSRERLFRFGKEAPA